MAKKGVERQILEAHAKEHGIPKRKIGRPSKLTEETAKAIVNLVRTGAYLETAAASVGVGSEVLCRWLKKGARAKSGKFHDFVHSIHEAAAQGECDDLLVVERSTRLPLDTGIPLKAAVQRLKWRNPQKYADQLIVKHEVERQLATLFKAVRPVVSAATYREFMGAVGQVCAGYLEDGTSGTDDGEGNDQPAGPGGVLTGVVVGGPVAPAGGDPPFGGVPPEGSGS